MAFPVYQSGQAQAYLVEKGWKFRTTGNQLVVEVCPFCGRKDYKFFLSNENGLWVCHHGKCAKKGNFFSLLREMGDGKLIAPMKTAGPAETKVGEAEKKWHISELLSYELALTQDQDALDYLKSRGFTLETCQAWHFGVKTEGADRWLMIPYMVDENHFVDIKYRTLPNRPAEGESWSGERRWKRLAGGVSILFGEHTLNEPGLVDGKRVLYLTEGELDAITLWQNGYRPAVSTTVGAGAWKERYYDLIVAYKPDIIYVVYDGDVAGQKGAADIVKRFEDPTKREVVNVVLPTELKDANAFFTKHTKEDFDKIINETKDAEIPNVRSLASVLDELATMLFLGEGQFQGVKSQFEFLNELLGGGFRNGELITISGIPGVGKTSYIVQELLRQAEIQKQPTYMLCLEMPEYRMAQKIITHKFHIPLPQQTYVDVQKVHQYLAKIPFYMGSSVMNLEHIGTTLKLAKKRYDIKSACFDNLNFFVRSTDKVTAEIAQFTKYMKELAVELDIPIFLIAQPRKFDDTARAMTIQDLKDSASIAQDSDAVILFYRQRIQTKAADVGKSKGFVGSHSPIVLCRVEKARYAAGGECYLYFDGEKSTFRELLPEENKQAAA